MSSAACRRRLLNESSFIIPGFDKLNLTTDKLNLTVVELNLIGAELNPTVAEFNLKGTLLTNRRRIAIRLYLHPSMIIAAPCPTPTHMVAKP